MFDQVSLGLFDDQGDDSSDSGKTTSGKASGGKTAKKAKGFQNINSVLKKYALKDKGGYITKEFQDFGFRLATTLNDLKHKSLYIKMAKTIDRAILERALSFVMDADSAKSKPRLFMWKVKQLRKEMLSRVQVK